jgi:hypothetical protein
MVYIILSLISFASGISFYSILLGLKSKRDLKNKINSDIEILKGVLSLKKENFIFDYRIDNIIKINFNENSIMISLKDISSFLIMDKNNNIIVSNKIYESGEKDKLAISIIDKLCGDYFKNEVYNTIFISNKEYSISYLERILPGIDLNNISIKDGIAFIDQKVEKTISIDDILDKISKTGIDSLTEIERNILNEKGI